MKQNDIVVGVIIEETTLMSFNAVCQKYRISEELLLEMAEHGIFSGETIQVKPPKLSQKDLQKIESAFRLHHDLEINLPGVALALELLEQIEQLTKELNILRKHF